MEKKKNKKVTTINELVGIMLGAFDSNQKYMDQRLDVLTGEMRNGFRKADKNFEQINNNFKEINKKIDNISLNTVDVIHKEQFDKLESRVADLEEVGHLPSKKS